MLSTASFAETSASDASSLALSAALAELSIVVWLAASVSAEEFWLSVDPPCPPSGGVGGLLSLEPLSVFPVLSPSSVVVPVSVDVPGVVVVPVSVVVPGVVVVLVSVVVPGVVVVLVSVVVLGVVVVLVSVVVLGVVVVLVSVVVPGVVVVLVSVVVLSELLIVYTYDFVLFLTEFDFNFFAVTLADFLTA